MRIRSRAYKMQATNGHVLCQITPATDLTIVEFINQNSNAFQWFSDKIHYIGPYWTRYIELSMRDTPAMPRAYKNCKPLIDMYYSNYLRPRITHFAAVANANCEILSSLI
jgi:hypothetical protein